MNKAIGIYVLLAYLLTWAYAFSMYGLYLGKQISEFQLQFWHALAALGPALAALVSTYIFYGKSGLKKLIAKIAFKKLPLASRLYVWSPLLFFAIGLVIYFFVKGQMYDFVHFFEVGFSTWNTTLRLLLPLLTYPIFEEIAWRGFLLPHLQEKFSAWWSTIYLAIIWALWHLPFFFYRFDFSLGISLGFFLGIFVGAIILTAIYNASQGYLIPVILFHFLNNVCSEFDKEIIVAVLSTGFIFIAIQIVKTLGKEHFSQSKRIGNYFKK